MVPQSDLTQHGTRVVIFAPLAALAGIVLATAALAILGPGSGLVTMEAVLAGGLVAFVASVAGFTIMGLRHLNKLEVLSRIDPLTGLPNRKALLRNLKQELAEEQDVALALLDLDRLKAINETHGYAVGDTVIGMISRILADICGHETRIYRLEGDEFAVTMKGQLAGTLLEGHGRRVIERMGKPIKVEDKRMTLGVSIGLARRNPDEACTAGELLRRAEVATHASKRGGKMRCTWFNSAFDRSNEQLKVLDEELRTALAMGEFRLHYQPLVESESRKITAVECLLRWDRPDGKDIGPNVFIPVAEESGLINSIGLWVLRQACCDALDWDGITLSVNISAAQLRNPEFPIQLGHILEETGFEPERLELEITETCLVLDPVVAERSLTLIRSFGVRVALDDFGTGYASIGFLRQFRFEKLKIDRSLVSQAHEDDGSRAMMLSSITVARAMNMDVTAEGVETEEQAAMVRAAGCDQIQGWLYFRPMPANEITKHLNGFADPAEETAGTDKGTQAA